ncbi:MAG: hypothetical protein ACP5E6_16180, partial [Acidiphilium sp.]
MGFLQNLRGRRPRSLRRIGTIGGVLAVVLGLGAYHVLGGAKPKPTIVSATQLPDTDATPGGDHATPYIRKVTDDEIRRTADQAERAHVSATADLPPATAAAPATTQVTLPAPVPPLPQGARTITTDYDPPPPATKSPPQINTARYNAYKNALAALQHQMTGPSYATHVYEKSDPSSRIVKASDPPPSASVGTDAVSRATTLMASRITPAETVLIPADHGVYGRTLTGVSSDQSNATVVVQAESGPIAGDRMSGHFSSEGDRLVVTLTELSLQDGQQMPIDAVLVAPDSMEEAV